MKIINPLYDKAFKYLMENNKLAKKVLSVILDVEIEELTLGHQETVFPDDKRSLTLFRLDFTALIREADGSLKKVLIELQKSKYATDIQRFRNYLGANYISKNNSVSEPQFTYSTNLPIITIYILGYKLDDLPYMAVTVDRHVFNSVSKEKIEVKSFFIELLTHQSHIIQVLRLPEKRQTRLEQFLLLFNQAWCTENKSIIDLQDIPEEFSDIAKYLQGPVFDEQFRRNLLAEEELDTIFDEQEAKYLKKIVELEDREKQERLQKLKAQKREEQERLQKLKAQEREDQAKEREKHAKEREKQLAYKLALQMKKIGASIEDIAKETGLSEDEIMKV